MSDEQFLNALEQCAPPETEFRHFGHLRAAYRYLPAGDFAAALARRRRTIRHDALRLGKPERYHETITVTCPALIRHLTYERGDGGGWPAFERDDPQLPRPGLLFQFYPREQLDSSLARSVFLRPRAQSARSASCV